MGTAAEGEPGIPGDEVMTALVAHELSDVRRGSIHVRLSTPTGHIGFEVSVD